jgi:hypothetical protein
MRMLPYLLRVDHWFIIRSSYLGLWDRFAGLLACLNIQIMAVRGDIERKF